VLARSISRSTETLTGCLSKIEQLCGSSIAWSKGTTPISRFLRLESRDPF
jgi:hypothetical protein